MAHTTDSSRITLAVLLCYVKVLVLLQDAFDEIINKMLNC